MRTRRDVDALQMYQYLAPVPDAIAVAFFLDDMSSQYSSASEYVVQRILWGLRLGFVTDELDWRPW